MEFWEAIEAEAPSLDEVFPKNYEDIPDPEERLWQAMKPLKTIYVAGKMQDDEWRRELFDPYTDRTDHARQLGFNPVTVSPSTSRDWPASTDPKTGDPYSGDYGTGIICGLAYTGPFFVDLCGGHGFTYFDGDEHGGNVNISEHDRQHGAFSLEYSRNKVQELCLQAIKRADLLFAWIDCIDCYGTIAEIGYAKALGKIILIAGPRIYNDLWFVYCMAHQTMFQSHMHFTPREFLEDCIKDYQKRCFHFDSPIEQAFWDAWCGPFGDQGGNEPRAMQLVPQYSIGSYRVDFAHIETKTAIELDGHATHSSPDAIAYDRKRQRWIEEQGWHVIRFGGKEIMTDLSKCLQEAYTVLVRRTKG